MYIGSEAATTIAFFAATASVAWSAAFAWAKWLARPQQPQILTMDAERRLRAVEEAVDAVAIEVERVGEAQRYTSRLLERLPSAQPATLTTPTSERSSRTITPH
jgi:hypothetical protein